MSALRDAKSRERMTHMNTTHGMSKHPAYSNWKDMKRRCFNPENKRYKDYAERGISVHTEFVNDFPAFLKEIGEKPSGRGWSVGRKDNNEGYTYGNLRWERPEQQARNHTKQRNNTSGVTGVKVRTRLIGGSYYTSYIAKWNDLDGKSWTKDFSGDKYGNEQAMQMAVAYRTARVNELNEMGAGYAASHGSAK